MALGATKFKGYDVHLLIVSYHWLGRWGYCLAWLQEGFWCNLSDPYRKADDIWAGWAVIEVNWKPDWVRERVVIKKV